MLRRRLDRLLRQLVKGEGGERGIQRLGGGCVRAVWGVVVLAVQRASHLMYLMCAQQIWVCLFGGTPPNGGVPVGFPLKPKKGGYRQKKTGRNVQSWP